MGVWERDDVGHCPESVENIGWGNLMRCGLPECIFIEEEDQDHEVSILGNWNWKGKAEMRKFQREGKQTLLLDGRNVKGKMLALGILLWPFLENKVHHI